MDGLLIAAREAGGVEARHDRAHGLRRIALVLALAAVGIGFPILAALQMAATSPSEWSFPAARLLTVGFLAVFAAVLGLVLGLDLLDRLGRLRRPLAFRTSGDLLHVDGKDHPLVTVERFEVVRQPGEHADFWSVVARIEPASQAGSGTVSLVQGLQHESDALWLHAAMDCWLLAASAAAEKPVE